MTEPTLGQLFSVPDPAVAAFPHLIAALDGELLAKVAHLTGSKPGLWHLPAPFDEEDVFDPWRDAEATPFARWALPANQAELMGGGRWATEALFGTNTILIDAEENEPAVRAAAQLRAERRDNGGFYEERFQDWAGWPRLLEEISWALVPVAPDRSQGLFVAAPAHRSWVDQLAEWCGRNGRSHWRVGRESDSLALVRVPASEEARSRAAAGQIDMFLARMARYFGLGGEELLEHIRGRFEADHRRREEVAQARERRRDPN